MISEFLAQQLSGPVSQSVINSAKTEFDKAQIVLDYMASADIDDSTDDFLYLLGQWAGMPWPVAPAGTFDDTNFEFGLASNFPETGIHGFNTGLLGSVSITALALYPIGVYRNLLKAFCEMKAYGSSVRKLEELVKSLWPYYTISFNSDNDIVFTFVPNVSGAYLYALRAITDRLTVMPQVIFQQG